MKRNLISIVILALLIVNIALTAIMMFSVVSTNRKTAALVTDITSAISLDLKSEEGMAEAVPMENTETYTIADMIIPLKKSTVADDGEGAGDVAKDSYAQLSLTLSMNSKHKDYKSYGEAMESREELIKGKVFELVSKHTREELEADPEALRGNILKTVQGLFNSDFIFDVTVRVLYQ